MFIIVICLAQLKSNNTAAFVLIIEYSAKTQVNWHKMEKSELLGSVWVNLFVFCLLTYLLRCNWHFTLLSASYVESKNIERTNQKEEGLFFPPFHSLSSERLKRKTQSLKSHPAAGKKAWRSFLWNKSQRSVLLMSWCLRTEACERSQEHLSELERELVNNENREV